MVVRGRVDGPGGSAFFSVLFVSDEYESGHDRRDGSGFAHYGDPSYAVGFGHGAVFDARGFGGV